jgi:hypothetical protein
MFYLFNVDAWLEEILDRCSEKRLNPQTSIFAIFMFSSLDIEYVNFFAKYKSQISAASGESVHLFTPVVYNDHGPIFGMVASRFRAHPPLCFSI